MKRVYLSTLGCKVNQFETAAIAAGCSDRGLTVTNSADDADVIVINTCAVTAKAGAQSRREIRRLAKRNRAARFVVTGCQAQLAADELRRLPELNDARLLIVGNRDKEALVAYLLGDRPPPADPILADMIAVPQIARLPVQRFSGRTRALLRIQDGCNHFCSYCIVPYTRGRSRSLPVDEVLAQAATYAAHGHRELGGTGVHVGQYGADLGGGLTCTTLLTMLCDRFPDLRFRLSSIEPMEIDTRLLTLMRERDNLMPHLHIPLQSGANEILARMNRRYSREQFATQIQACREALPDAAIGIDVLVGFPGEKTCHFNNTMALLEQIDCSYLHVFPYSRRPGTRAATFPNQVTAAEKQRRVEVLRALGEQVRTTFIERHLGSCRTALIEAERDEDGLLRGYTDNYIAVHLAGNDGLKNSVVTVTLEKRLATGAVARLAEQP